MNNSSVFGWKIINIEFFSSLYSSAHSLSFSSQWALVAFVIITGISNCTSNNTDLSNSANQTDEKLELSRVFYPDQFSTCKSIVSGWGQETLLTTVGEPHPPPASLSKIPKDKVLDGRFQSFYQLLSSQGSTMSCLIFCILDTLGLSCLPQQCTSHIFAASSPNHFKSAINET